ncbi:MAG: hypothetical protein NTX75_04075 [Proteobacteria bacterium]|nr:hypothetical protein [Pseudomonadota bacterium]
MEQQFYVQISQLDSAINEPQITDGVAEHTIGLLKTNIELSNYFFKNVHNLQWFKYLSAEGYFLPEKISYDQAGNAFFWNVLDYLDRISGQVDQNPPYGKELINIIESIVHFSQSRQRINNYHIWWYCVKILNNIQVSIIRDSLSLENFNEWLSVWTDHAMGNDLAISDIGEKLLPKFLNDTFGVEYAEAIIGTITRIKAGDKPSISIGRQDAVLAWHSYWVRATFRKNHQLIGQRCSVNAILAVADQLRKALKYEQKRHYSNIRIGGDAYRIDVSRVLAEGIKAGAIEFEEGQYNCIVTQFTEDQLKEVTSDDESGDFYLYNTEPQVKLEQFTFKAFTINGFMQEIRKNLSQNIEWVKAKDFEKEIGNIFDGLHSDYSHIWCGSLAEGPEYGDNAKEVLTTALRDVLLAKCGASRAEGEQVLNAFLSDKYPFPIFGRFVLLCVDKFWADYVELLDKFFNLIPTALEEPDFEVELQDVLDHHNVAFGTLLKKRLIELINNVPEYYIKKGEKLTAYWKYKWLSPLRENPDFSVLYEKAKEKAEIEGGEPYEVERSSLTGGVVDHKSPVFKEDILQRPIPDLVKYLNDFKGVDSWQGTFKGEPDKEGLAGILQTAVQENPTKFTDEIDAFLNTGDFYLHRVFSGLEKAWNDDKDIDWERFLDFSIKYLGRSKDTIIQTIQDQGEDSGGGKYIRVVEDIVDLIADGCRNDQRAFDPRYFDKAEQIFELVLPLLKGEKHPDTQRDALTYALNTTLGRVIMAYISFSLRKARVTQKRQEHWGQKGYEPFFAIGIEAYIWFGSYLPQMKYLDERYAKEKIDLFAQKSPDDFEWQMFMEGYLTGARVYPEVYSLMRANYVNALESNPFEERIDKRLVEHISLGYLYYGERLEENNADGKCSLFWKMLSEMYLAGQGDRWLKVVSFFSSHTGRAIKKEDGVEKETPEEIKKRILEFWAWTFDEQDFVKTRLGDTYGSFLGQMAGLTVLLDKIDDEKEKWLTLCVPHLDRHHNAVSFIKYLTKFDDEDSIKRIGKIFLKLLENTTPTFMQEHIEVIVRRIYEKGNRDDAEAICNTYGRRGIHFLKPLWEEYRQS